MTTSHIFRLRLWPRRISSGVISAALLGGAAIGPGDVLREGGVSSSMLGVARAQVGGGEETPATKAAREALQAAIDKARAEGKLLIVTLSNSRENVAANARMLQHGAVRRWLAPRANTHDITDRGVIASVMTTLTGTEITPVAGIEPLVLLDGKPLALPMAYAPLRSASRDTLDGSLVLAYRLDWALRDPERQRQRPGLAQMVAAMDQRAMAGPGIEQGIDPEMISAKAITIAKAEFRPFDPGEVDGRDPLKVLARARALAKDKPLEAAMAYAWLWERGEIVLPSFSTARLTTVAREMHTLAQGSKPVQGLFMRLREAQSVTVDLARPETVYAHLILSRVVEDHQLNMQFLDSTLNRKEASALISRPSREILDRLLATAHFNDPTQNASDPWRAPASMFDRAAELAGGQAAGNAADVRVDFYRWLARHEAARRYARVLPAPGEPAPASPPRRDRAGEILTRVLPKLDTPEFRALLRTSAQAAGKVPAETLK